MLLVHVYVHVTPGSESAFLDATEVNARSSLDEPGVLRFDVLRDADSPERFILVELYRDSDAAAAHKTTAHYATWRDTVADMMAEPRSSQKYTPIFPSEAERWRTPAASARDTMGWDG
jgi:quinol monooxygenase YgiN